MSEELNAIDWLMIACALALGFGVIKFLIVTRNDREGPPPGEEGVDDDRTG